jgi:photosystem II stability/assembly factor-like uncharacterized protein
VFAKPRMTRLSSPAALLSFLFSSAVVLAQNGIGVSSPSAATAASWRLTSPALFDVRVTAVAIDPLSPSTIYVGGYTGGGLHTAVAIFRTDDSGSTWHRIQNGVAGLSLVGLRVNPADPNVLYVGTYGGGVFKSVDRGESWTRLIVGQLPWVGSLVLDERHPDTLYVSIGGDGNYRTVDGGNAWTPFSGPPGTPGAIVVWLFLPDPLTDGRIYASDFHSLYRSDDAGASWQLVREGIQELLWIGQHNSSVLYARGDAGALLKSIDRGITWTAIGAGLPTADGLGALVADTSDPSVLYIGTGGHGVFRSADGGISWTAFNEGIAFRSVGPLLIPPSGGPLLYAGTDAGLFDYRARAEFQVTVPAVASLHGVPPAFFHSDVWIFNGSADSEATVTATYRCLSGTPCSEASQMFTIPPRQVKVFRDIAVTLFSAPETAGAVEFESDRLVVVTSRLYTPDVSQPTTGMFVPGRKPEEASASQVLTSLSHSADPGRGFRTNVGFYNGTDTASFVNLEFFEASGPSLGEIRLFVGPRHSLQLNDGEVVQRLGIARDIPDFFCIVSVSGETRIHAYAAVIDNRSQDPILVTGQDAAAMPESNATLPAAASLHGAGGAFFHSDARVWNASPTTFATVTARYVCFTGSCGDAEQSFLVAPRHELILDDLVTSLFHAPETGGAVEFVSAQPLVVSSRLYTPGRSAPTLGMFVPGLAPRRASPTVVLNGLSHPATSESGARVNVGVFNQASVPQLVTYRLFDGSGNRLGQATRLFAAREIFQVNDVFAFFGVPGAIESAYCLVEASENLPLFAYAAVIDNRSQDPIFIPGEDDPEHPPIVPLGAPK